ncbi:MAG TPA: DUF1592 domain-containing protein [Polyangiaceae bacterium]
MTWALDKHGMGQRSLLALGALLFAHAPACDVPNHDALPGGRAGSAPSGGAPAGGASPTGGTSPSGGGPLMDPGRKDMHRLNTGEYNATVRDVLGTTLQPATANWRGGELSGFDNMASVLGMDETQYDRYFKAAQALATEVFASEELRARFVSCELEAPECVRTSIETAGLGLFRRPLAPDEVATFQRVYEGAIALGDAPFAALELVVQALLSSAEFLYRIELDPEPQSAVPHPLGAFELASRLSYFLWSSAPDNELLRVAADGSLLEPATLSAVVDRMLEAPKSERFISNFAGQWLGARQVVSHPVDTTKYEWTPHLSRAAADEITLFFSEFVRSERSWFEFPTADFNYVNDWLAAHYGMPTPAMFPARVEFKEDARIGFFGLAGFLAITSFDRRTSPSLRGRWIAGNMLCMKPPEPPPNVPKLDDTGQDSSALSVRELLEQHRQSDECAGCHSLFDPYGLALEEYDAVGKYRSVYADGTPVDATAILESDAYPEGLSFAGLEGLANVVANDPQFGKCLVEKLLTYGLGRPVTPSDAPYIEQALRDWSAPEEVPSIRRLIRTLVLSEVFRLRRGESEAMP